MPPDETAVRGAADRTVEDAQLVAPLAREVDSELRLAAACLYASFSLKSKADEGDLTAEQAAAVRAWKRALWSAGVRRLERFGHLWGILRSAGATPAVDHRAIVAEPFPQR